MIIINEQEHCSRFFDLLTSFNLFPQITLPTRFTTCNGTLIDHFSCNLTKYILESTAGILIKQFSDHQPYFIIMDTSLKKQYPTKFIEINIQNKKAMLKVKEDLISTKIYENLDISPKADTNRSYKIILDEINQAKNKHMMSKLVNLNKYKHRNSTWITPGLLASIRHRDKLYKQIKLTNPDSPEHEMLLINLRTYNVILKRSFRIAKQSYFETRLNKLKFDIKNT